LRARGFHKRTNRRVALAAAVVGGESLVFLANGARCPLTELAKSLGAESGSVTDIYLPAWFAHNLPAMHVPLIVLAALLHGRNLRRVTDGTFAA
jgi:ABC-type antimicrobial peptide transport system permease subunit